MLATCLTTRENMKRNISVRDVDNRLYIRAVIHLVWFWHSRVSLTRAQKTATDASARVPSRIAIVMFTYAYLLVFRLTIRLATYNTVKMRHNGKINFITIFLYSNYGLRKKQNSEA